MPLHRFGDLVADPIDRIERQAGVLEDHRHRAAAIGGKLGRRHRQHVAAVDRDGAADPAPTSDAAASARAR